MIPASKASLPSMPDADTPPAARPLRAFSGPRLAGLFDRALGQGDGALGAHCVHEQWMRGASGPDVEQALERLWARAAESIPDWLPMRHVDWLPAVYRIAGGFRAAASGRSHLYLVLLDYRERREGPFGLYVGMSRYPAAVRFDQHKAGIRAAGSVLKRGLEVLPGPVRHLQYVRRAEAARIEGELAAALAAAGLIVKGGH